MNSGLKEPEGYDPICINDIVKARIKEKIDEYT